ncbi:MAG: hypothetical protein JWL84_4175 [Rhodospirillales bacterium]|nr:hypothetical protein [Rhodospirillales bacterium]
MKLAQAAPRHQFVLLPTRRLALAMAIRVIPIGSRTRSGIGMTSMVSRASAPLSLASKSPKFAASKSVR